MSGLWICLVLALSIARAAAMDLATETQLRLGWDIPMERIDDVEGVLTPEDVGNPQRPQRVTTTLHQSLNAGYLRHVVWLRLHAPELMEQTNDHVLWLLAQPTYLDHVTLYQRSADTGAWAPQHSGDLVPAEQKSPVRQHLFRLSPGQLTLIRIETTSAMQFQGKVLSSQALGRELTAIERYQGLYFGAACALLLGMAAAALIFKTSALRAMLGLGLVSALHLVNVRGYTSLWAPTAWTEWASHAVGIGAFAIAAAVAWQIKVQLTAHTRYRQTDRLLAALTALNLLGTFSVPLHFYGSVAWINLVSLLVCNVIAVALCLVALRQGRRTAQHAVLLFAYGMHALSGAPLTLIMVGQSRWDMDITNLWQLESLAFMVLLGMAIFIGMVVRYRKAIQAKDHAIDRLAESEHRLEDKVAVRTVELSIAQSALSEALQSERTLRHEQRQFFHMISHEFRTPLAVIDSAAAEQQAFPSTAMEDQTERAAQIRRACRRLTSLVDSCLINERMDTAGFTLHPSPVHITDLMEHAAQLVRWSSKHHLRLFTHAAPLEWICDGTLVRIALSNLVDNAVKFAKAGEIFIAARKNEAGLLEFSVADEGSGMSLEVMNKIFAQFERGDRTDQSRGFGLGLWVARRVALLHGGEIDVESRLGHGTCFRLTIAAQRLAK
ncbi:ATP-binding protein [Acidovorax sp. 106]|uniref:sensor histidine kinase n=1 Tax=Acidovorax sp. 106 TaxID=2135637 RepID=UPI000F130546|nr:ATP-binding protein [Acidovorax sp. 106]RLJ39152.1 signal transduction histidine kinase [Acidovorax sp. 106]